MNSNKRIALGLASLVASLAATPSAHAGGISAGAGGGGGGGGAPTPIDVLGTGQPYSQVWDPVNFDAKRDIKAFGDVVSHVSSLVGTIPSVTGSADADAAAKVHGEAYANPASAWYMGGSMGVRAQAEFDASANFAINGNALGFSAAPYAKVDVSYVKPGLMICWTGNCNSGPYYHELLETRGFDGSISDLVNLTQTDPLSLAKEADIFESPTLPSFSYGVPFVGTMNVNAYANAEVQVIATTSLNPTGGQAKLDAAAHSDLKILGLVGTGVAAADVYFTVLDGPAYSHDLFIASTAAQGHTIVYLGASSTQWGNKICGGAQATLNAQNIGAYWVFAQAAGQVAVNESGQGYSWSLAPVFDKQQCVWF